MTQPLNLAQLAAKAYRASQDPWELGVLLDVVRNTIRPRLMLEIGSWYGGSLFAWASIGVDVLAVTLPETRDFLEDGHQWGATMVYGNSHDAEMLTRIPEAAAGRTIDFAFIDGDHSESGCRDDFGLCVTLGIPVIGMHDIDGTGDPGVRKVWDEVSARFRHAVILNPCEKPVGTGIVWL
jgi:hypothetical protein